MRAFALVAFSCFAASAQAAEKRYSVPDFEMVRVIGGARVEIMRARAVGVTATGSPQALEELVIEVADRELRIQPRARVASTWAGNGPQPATIRVTVPRLAAVRVSGSARVTVDELSAASVAMAVTGSGALTIRRVVADRATLGLTGAGSVTAAGKVKALTAATRGSGIVDAVALSADDATVTAATSGRFDLTAIRSATVTSTGSGEVTIAGKPACTVTNTGSGTVSCGR